MATPNFNINDAFIYSPKSDTDGSELSIENQKKVFAQNVNQSQNEFGYFWSSANVQLNTTTQNKTAISVANYTFENILEDRSTIEQHNNITDLYIADRIDFQNNTKHLGNSLHKGIFFFMPSFTNTSNNVNLQIYGQSTLKLLKLGTNNKLVELQEGDIIADSLCIIAYNYRAEQPCFILYELLSSDLVQYICGKYNVLKRFDLVNNLNTTAQISQSIINTQDGTLIKDKVEENGTKVVKNAIYYVYKIDLDGTIHYHENILKAGDIVFVEEEKEFYFFNGEYLIKNGADGKYVLNAYTDNGSILTIDTDQSDFVYVNSLSGDRTITLSGNPNHMQKIQVFLNINTVGNLTFSNVNTWLDNSPPVFNESGVYPLVFLYDGNLQKWIGNTQGVYK